MNFANVASMKIPEGEVVKITSGGVVLWELMSDGLPAGYTQCEYLQLDGGQCVDTEIVCDQNSKIEMTFTREDSSSRYLFGAESSGNTASFTGYQSGTSSGSWRFGAAYGRPSVTVNVKHTFTMDKDGIVMDGSRYRYNGTIGTFTTPQSLVVGTVHNTSGAIGTTLHIGKIYGFKLWDGDELKAEYIPCKNPQGVYGFWDNVARKFRDSDGSSAFTGG